VVVSAVIAFSRCASAPAPPAPRDRFPLDPRGGLTGPFDPSIERGWRALEAGDPAGAHREFARASGEDSRRAAAIGSIESLVGLNRAREAEALCAGELELPQSTVPLLTACGEAAWLAGDEIAAFERYDRAAERSPGRAGIANRTEELRARATDVTLAAALRDAQEGRRAEARVQLAKALAWNPASGPVLARAA
jgi:hypothetical protein